MQVYQRRGRQRVCWQPEVRHKQVRTREAQHSQPQHGRCQSGEEAVFLGAAHGCERSHQRAARSVPSKIDPTRHRTKTVTGKCLGRKVGTLMLVCPNRSFTTDGQRFRLTRGRSRSRGRRVQPGVGLRCAAPTFTTCRQLDRPNLPEAKNTHLRTFVGNR